MNRATWCHTAGPAGRGQRPGAAQTVDLTPRIGAYVPLVNLIEGTDPLSGLPREQKAETKFTIGGRLGVWFGRSFGIEGVADYNRSGVETFLRRGARADTSVTHLRRQHQTHVPAQLTQRKCSADPQCGRRAGGPGR